MRSYLIQGSRNHLLTQTAREILMITVTNNTITKTETVIPAIVDEGRPLQQSIGHVEHVSPMLDEQISSPHTAK